MGVDVAAQMGMIRPMDAKPSWRRSARYPVVTEAMLVAEPAADPAEHWTVQTRDLSREGIFLETSLKVRVGEEVKLLIADQEGSAGLRVHAEVVRVDPGVGFGARFQVKEGEAARRVQSFVYRICSARN